MKKPLAILAAAALFTTAKAAAFTFNLIDLGTLGGSTSFALDINNLGQISGNSQTPATNPSPRLNGFLYNDGTMTNLGVLPGSNNFSRGYSLNDSGVVVGESDNNISRAFVYQNGIMTGLTRLAGDNDRGVAHGINNAGIIVGISSDGTASRATRWTDSGAGYVPADLGTIAGTPTSTGRAYAINESGAIAGLSTNGAGTSQATLWDAGTITNLTSLGDGTKFSQAFDLNDNRQIVGSSSTGQTVGNLIGTTSTTSITRGFLWEDGTMTELAPFNLYTPSNNGSTTNYHSVANDINNAGLVVGNSQRIAGSAAVATLWENAAPIDLNTFLPADSGWVLRSAEGINAQGDIVGFGTLGGNTRAFLLQSVPEPGSASLALIGGLGLLFRRRRR